MKNFKNILHNAGFYLDFINESQKLALLVSLGDFEEAQKVAEYINNKFFKEV